MLFSLILCTCHEEFSRSGSELAPVSSLEKIREAGKEREESCSPLHVKYDSFESFLQDHLNETLPPLQELHELSPVSPDSHFKLHSLRAKSRTCQVSGVSPLSMKYEAACNSMRQHAFPLCGLTFCIAATRGKARKTQSLQSTR